MGRVIRPTRHYSAKPHPCYLCSNKILYDNPLACRFTFRSEVHSICSACRSLYWGALEQAAAFGKRYRFIEKSEIPQLDGFGMSVGGGISPVTQHKVFTRIFRMLLLIRERQRHQQKESDWMIDDMTRKLLKLPDQMAAMIGKTYAVRGDDFELSDDEVLLRIKTILESIDPDIIDRNKNRKRIQGWW